MTTYFEYHVNLSDGQKESLAIAIESSSEITLRLKNNQLRGNDELMLTKTQIKKIEKALQNNTGVDIKISKTQIRKSVKHGGSLFSSLLSLGTKLLPYATKFAAPLTTGALSALGSLGMNKIFGKGQNGGSLRGGFLIPNEKIELLIKKQKPVNTKTKRTYLEQSPIRRTSRGETNTKTTRRRFGNITCKYRNSFSDGTVEKTFWSRLASCSRLTRSIKRKRTPTWTKTRYDWGNPTGSGTKKKFRKRHSLRPKQPILSHSNLGKHLLKPKFKDIPLSNFDLLNWIDYLRIPNFKGIFFPRQQESLAQNGFLHNQSR